MNETGIDAIEVALQEHLQMVQALIASDLLRAALAAAAAACAASLAAGGKILLAGNGGSAADAQHVAGELVGRFAFDRPGLPAVALTVDTSILTAVANDYGYEAVFARQVQALGAAGDVFIGYSTSGRSPNILRALAETLLYGDAQQREPARLLLVGIDGAVETLVRVATSGRAPARLSVLPRGRGSSDASR